MKKTYVNQDGKTYETKNLSFFLDDMGKVKVFNNKQYESVGVWNDIVCADIDFNFTVEEYEKLEETCEL